MSMIIDGIDFQNLEPQKYWAPPASWSLEKKKETTNARIFSGDFYGAEKRDGYFSKLVKDDNGNIGLFSRSKNVNGEYPEKSEWVPQLKGFFDWLPSGTCLLGELYLPSKPGSSNITTLLGCLKEKCIARQNAGEKLHFYIFDVLAYKGESVYNQAFTARIAILNSIFNDYADEVEPGGYLLGEGPSFGFVEFASYKSGRELWTLLQTTLANGGEGIVITRGSAPYQPGKRPSKDCQKVKKELEETVDCFFTGRGTAPTRLYTGKEIQTWKYWEDMRTGEKKEGDFYKDYSLGAAIEPVTKPYFLGMVGSMEIGVLKDGKVHSIGYLSGLADEIKANPKAYAMTCIEVTAMEIMPDTYALRHGKLKCFRPDLTVKDCTWEKYTK